MPKILIVDTYYPEALNAIEQDMADQQIFASYHHRLQHAMSWQFGTGDFYSRHLRTFGWEVMDVIANYKTLQNTWAYEFEKTHDWKVGDTVAAQIEWFKPDVIFLQDLGCLGYKLPLLKDQYFIAGQSSCAIRRELISNFKVIFTSFPYYMHKYGNQPYCKFVYNPLAFEMSVLDNPELKVGRPHNVVFVGGVGAPAHWARGMTILEQFARDSNIGFEWWGYGIDTLPHNSALRFCYRGQAWGRDMYRIYRQTKIVLNRHGEIAGAYANNMRMYEATGCGALLLTEARANLGELFESSEVAAYGTPEDAIRLATHYLTHPDELEAKAMRGQQRTHIDHTYYQHMKTVSDTLMEMILP